MKQADYDKIIDEGFIDNEDGSSTLEIGNAFTLISFMDNVRLLSNYIKRFNKLGVGLIQINYDITPIEKIFKNVNDLPDISFKNDLLNVFVGTYIKSHIEITKE